MRPEFQTLYQIEAKIRAGLDRSLPGLDAHLVLAPRPRSTLNPGQVPRRARMAAAMVLFYPISGKPHLLLTVRADELARHAGQVCLPGGGLRKNETVNDGALREVFEEVGVDPQQIRLLGRLSKLYIPVSNFALHPVVGVLDNRPILHMDEGEVGRILEIPLAELLTTAGPYRGYRWHDQHRYQVPYLELGGERVWGATAMVLSELVSVIEAPLEDPWKGTVLEGTAG